jgi:hypothetical protein
MYFVFNAILESWQGALVQAKIVGKPPQTTPHWWDCVPLNEPLPLLSFTTRQNAPMFDNYFTGTIFDIYSDKLISILRQSRVTFELFPVSMLDNLTDSPLETKYNIFHILESFSGLDRKLSDIDDDNVEIRRIVLTEECLRLRKPFFRLNELSLLLIHEELKATLEANQITGCSYTPLEEYQVL